MTNRRITCKQIAEFRYSIVGELFARPPEKGQLAERLREISQKEWRPFGSSFPEKYSVRTLERWYAKAKINPTDPIAALLPARRKDLGIRYSIRPEHIRWLKHNLHYFGSWSIKLRYDNLILVKELAPTPSYSTILRWLHSIGIFSTGIKGTIRKKTRETLSFESMYPGELWHLDMHKTSRKVLLPTGEYANAYCVAYIDDHSRLCSHCQWVLHEDTDSLVHITKQAFLKHGIPFKIQSDNGSAMISNEYETGLARIGVRHEKIIPRAAFQNGKIESFWNPLEGRLIKMLSKVMPLTLDVLNYYTQPWVNVDYNASIHSETGQKPCDRYMTEKNTARISSDFTQLGQAFRRIEERTQRLSDGTVSIGGVKFQVPVAYRHIKKLHIAYTQWDLSCAAIVDGETSFEIAPIYPVDKARNASGFRCKTAYPLNSDDLLLPFQNQSSGEIDSDIIPPLLAHCVTEFEKLSPVSGYIPLMQENT